MRLTIACLLFAVLVPGLLLGADNLPTQEQIKADFDAGQYNDCLKKLAQVLDLSEAKSKDYDKCALWMLKADATLALKRGPDAQTAYRFAAKVAKDKKDIAKAKALESLISRSPGLKYTPKSKDPKKPAEPISIVEKASRDEALKALYTDQLVSAQAQMNGLMKSSALPPIVSFAPTIETLGQLELAIGEAHEASDMQHKLADHAKDEIKKVLADSGEKVDRIRKSANQTTVRTESFIDPISKRTMTNPVYGKRGLNGADNTTLRGVITTTEKLAPWCKDLSAALDSDFNETLKDAERVHSDAKEVLTADYSEQTHRRN